jgi:hypothetical protein
MTKKTLLGLWLAAAFAFVLAVALLPGWEYVGEGSYLRVNLIPVWVLIILIPMVFVTVWWFAKNK